MIGSKDSRACPAALPVALSAPGQSKSPVADEALAVSKDAATYVCKEGSKNYGADASLQAAAAYHTLFLKDGGGLPSTLDWQLAPPSGWRDPLQAVRQALWKSLPSESFSKMHTAMSAGLAAPLFTDVQVSQMRSCVCDALGLDHSWALQSFELTPYKFNLLQSLATKMGDIDVGLCDALKFGAPTGVKERVPPSGVWPPVQRAINEEDCLELDLAVCLQNHASAEDDPARVKALVEKEVDAGFMQRVPGGLPELHRRFGDAVAVGKLGVVQQEGKDDRLIGDSRASQASPACKFSERMELPSLYHYGAALSRQRSEHTDWFLFSIDIKGAHKSIRTAPTDCGLAAFQVQGEFYIYVVNHFGAAWSAHWWSRLAALLMRVAHHLLRHRHIGGVYVDDFLFLLPRATAIPMATLVVALFQCLGVPLSWKKVQMGLDLTFLGWDISLRSGFNASNAQSKQAKFLQSLDAILARPRQVSRLELQRLLGLCVWATQVCLRLRPFLAPVYKVLHRRSQKLVCLSLQQIEELVPLLGSDLVVQACPQLSDVQKDWCLVGIGSHGCSYFTTAQRLLQQPAVRNGKLWLRFRAWGPTASLDELAVVSLKILKARPIGQTFNLLQPRPIAGAADAWADATVAGLGGWFCDRNGELRWFHLQLVATDFPADWEWPQTMQSGISALELLAQQVLVQLQGSSGLRVVLHQFSDNMGAVGTVAKGLCTKFPLGAALMNLSCVCLSQDCELVLSHLAGERNEEADQLSRLNSGMPLSDALQAKFHEGNRMHIAASDVFRPWFACLKGS